MRKLNPRAWIPSLNRYATGYDALYYHRQMNEGGEWWVYPAGEDDQLDAEIELPTGLKDKNGKEIYEGDIVRTTNRVMVKGLIFPIGVVEFKQQAFWICNVPSERPDFTHNETLLQYWETDLEIIGNIHENHELLEEE